MRRLLFLCVLAFPALARAEGSWSLTPADFNRTAIVIRSPDDRTLSGTDHDKPIVVPLDRVLRLDRGGAEPVLAAHFTLFTTTGDRLIGEPGDLKDESMAWTSPVLGVMKLPIDSLRAVTRAAVPPAALDEERKEDQIILANHDVVRGVVSGVEDGKILMQVNGETSPVPLASAEGIFFASPGKAAPGKKMFRLRFIDGSRFTTPTLRMTASKVTVTLGDGVTRDVDQANVLSIEQLNGPVQWLSDQTPTSSEQTPFNSEITFPAKFDRNVFGKPLRVSSQTFEKGIGVHANSRLVFALDGTYKTFRTRYGLDTSADPSQAAVSVRVLLDGKVVHERSKVQAYEPMPLVKVDLGDAKTLTLEVTAAGPTDTQDRLDWVDAALVREVPPTTSPASHPASQPTSP